MVSMDVLIVKIMTFAKKLVTADRASLFLVDNRTKELYARIFDVSGDGNGNSDSVSTNLEATTEIRFPMGTGIAGNVAQTGKALNIPDCYSDHRFNRHIDQQTGYTTKNLLCMPIFIRGNVIGVVQMVNKINGVFTKMDEEAFSTFAIYCGLALYHTRLYEKIHRSEQKYKVAMEILSYHNTATEEELNEIKERPILVSPSLCQFDFSPSSLSPDDQVIQTVAMFHDLFTPGAFQWESLYRFALTVRKNYRKIPYHNFTHGFSVANAVFVVIKESRGKFRPLEELSLVVSCLCHDLDHRGRTNQFLINSKAPLAAMYSTSVLEHHHFNQTVSILQQDGHNIFKSLTADEYRQVLGNIKHCILSTDLASFFPNMSKLKDIVDRQQFHLDNVQHRLLLQAITMTACDLVASTKPWDQQIETVRVIFEEFYEQGDAERVQGKEPIAMMDRTKVDQQPTSQVGFLRGICIPCYELLADIVPETKPLLHKCRENLDKWETLVKKQQEGKNSGKVLEQAVGST
ncbi:putative 3',5'-cyclic phosphodiesterase pde-5 [Halotydeus destructor]|nr:putative 3',5'-cyclic phosphodiesterase pde-5 [Halotydeus destructor]